MENKFGSIHYNAIGPYLKNHFGGHVAKLTIDGGFSCPNRDGSKGLKGCTFCHEGGGGFPILDIKTQISNLSDKWPDSRYIAYFQYFSNTYGPVDILRQKYDEALELPDVVGLAIATRPDCLGDDVIELLKEYNEKTFLWVELGLQTANDATAALIERGYGSEIFDDCFERLNRADIRAVVHLIFGLPGESHDDMLGSVKYVANKEPFGVKLHHLYVMEGTRIAESYPDRLRVLEKDEYIGLVIDSIELISPDITIHRIGGDPPAKGLIAPLWSLDKRSVLNEVQKEFKRRGSWQGSRL